MAKCHNSLKYPWPNFISFLHQDFLSQFPQSIDGTTSGSGEKRALYLAGAALRLRAGNIIQFNKIGNILEGQSYELAWILHNAVTVLLGISHHHQL